MGHPSYPSRALDSRWRASYLRAARHLVALVGLSTLFFVASAWLVVNYAR